MQQWKTVARERVAKFGKYLTVERRTIELPDGRTIADWPWLIMPDYINVVAVTDEEQFVCFRQVKYAVDGTSLAVVGGYLEPGEEPLAAAQRELREETGYAADEWIALGHYVVDANRGGGSGYAFLARGARYVGHSVSDDLEEQELLLLTRDQVETALSTGELKAMPWTAAIALALLKLS